MTDVLAELKVLCTALCLLAPVLLVLMALLSNAVPRPPRGPVGGALELTVARVAAADEEGLSALLAGLGGGEATPGGRGWPAAPGQALAGAGLLLEPRALRIAAPGDPLEALVDGLGELPLQPLVAPDEGPEALVAVFHADLPELIARLREPPAEALPGHAAQLVGPLLQAAERARAGESLLLLARA